MPVRESMITRHQLKSVVPPHRVSRTATKPQHRSRLGRCAWGLVLVLASLPGTGCQTGRPLAVNEAMLVSYRDMVWARRAYNLRFGNCDRPFGEHFYNGFCAGYADVCNGGDGYVPALPPSAYRTPRFQSPEGAQCVNAWFEGYPAGVAAAKQEKVGNFNDVMVSKMIDSAVATEKNANRLLPSDVPITKGDLPQKLEVKTEIAAPPDPAALSSSILIPNPDTLNNNAQPQNAELMARDQQLRTPSTESQNATKLPPIVQSSGIVREAKRIRPNVSRSAARPMRGQGSMIIR